MVCLLFLRLQLDKRLISRHPIRDWVSTAPYKKSINSKTFGREIPYLSAPHKTHQRDYSAKSAILYTRTFIKTTQQQLILSVTAAFGCHPPYSKKAFTPNHKHLSFNRVLLVLNPERKNR